jgi:diacylglycerol O-acyltransferase / wax synthase
MMRSTVTGVEVLDHAPDWSRLVDAHEWACRMVPRFRDRVREPLGVVGAAVWERAPRLDLHYHVRRARLGGDGGWHELFSMVEQFAMTPFDRARPPWEALLIEGLPDGKAAYVMKLHHALSDGLGLTDLLSLLHSRQRAHNPCKTIPKLNQASGAGAGNYLARQLRRDLATVAHAIRSGGVAVVNGFGNPVAAARDSARYASSARRVLSPPAAPGSPLLAARGTSWRFVALDVPLDDLRAASKAAGGSLNDGFLAALLAGFRRYHEHMGMALGEDAVIPVSVPVSTRRDKDIGGGNHFAPARLAAPVGVADPRARIELIRRQMRVARDEPALRSAELIAPLLARIPAPLIVRLAAATTAGNDLQASNVAGPREALYLAGARIERLFPPRHELMRGHLYTRCVAQPSA